MFKFVCEVCGKSQIRKRKPKANLCKSCKTKQTNLLKYGVECVFQSPSIKNQIKKTNIKKYGVENVFQSNIIREKIVKTNLERYGVDNIFKDDNIQKAIRKLRSDKYHSDSPLASEAAKTKYKNTCMKKFGVENPLASKVIQSQIEKTNIEKYGFKSPIQNKTINLKRVSTNLKKYGTECVFQNENIKIKIRDTCLEKYGVDHYSKTKECRERSSNTWKLLWEDFGKLRGKDWGIIHKKAIKAYEKDGICFDSSWELAYFIYLIDQNIDFEYQCDPIEYLDDDGTAHSYIPDFKIKDQLIEIKGDHFFTKGGQFINPFDRSEKMDSHCKKKYECMLENNVKILKSKDMKSIIEYIQKTYGKDFLEKHKKLKK